MTDNFNLLNNSPVEKLSEETDYFGTLKKAQAIEHFLSNCFKDKGSEIDKNLKMISLYGNWGSGKSSVINYLKNNLEGKKFKTLMFEAWQYEKDNDLVLSMSECITSNINKSNEAAVKEKIKSFSKACYGLFIKPLSNVSVTIPMAPPSAGAPTISIKGSDILNSIENYIKTETDYDSLSFNSRLEKFKDSFIEIEKSILGERTDERIIVFVDDLDRCEPEHVIDILSAIKNFFIYGKKTIFFCALDKDAVTKAIQTKYKDVIKADEYLEKIFDVSFNMPSNFSIEKLLDNYFSGNTTPESGEISITKELASFFEFIGFTNPRHLKKVLNKYEILRSFKSFDDLDGDYKNLIPNILSKNTPKEGSFFETILVLYIIILYEFYNEKFNDLEDYDGKIKNYILKLETTNTSNYYNNSDTIKELLKFENKIYLSVFSKSLRSINIIPNDYTYKKELFSNFRKLLPLFLPFSNEKFYFDTNKINEITNKINQNQNQNMLNSIIKNFLNTFIEQFNNKENAALYSFTKYFINLVLEKNHLIDIKNGNYEFKNLFVMARDLL